MATESDAPSNNKSMQLLVINGSPWSERARFALKVAGLLDEIEIVPFTPYWDAPKARKLMGLGKRFVNSSQTLLYN